MGILFWLGFVETTLGVKERIRIKTNGRNQTSRTIYSLNIFTENPLSARHSYRQRLFLVTYNRDNVYSLILTNIHLTLRGIMEDAFSTHFRRTSFISIFAIKRRKGIDSK